MRDISPEFLASLSLAPQDAIGRDWHALAAKHGLDDSGALAAALAAKVTWSGLDLVWTAASSRTPVTLGATPLVDVQRRFAGYKGFGTLHLARMESIAASFAQMEEEPGDADASVAAEARDGAGRHSAGLPPAGAAVQETVRARQDIEDAMPSGGDNGEGEDDAAFELPSGAARTALPVPMPELPPAELFPGHPVAPSSRRHDGPRSLPDGGDTQDNSPPPPGHTTGATAVATVEGEEDGAGDDPVPGFAASAPASEMPPALVPTPSPQADDMKSGEHRRILDPASLHQALREHAPGGAEAQADDGETDPATGAKVVQLRPLQLVPRSLMGGAEPEKPAPEKSTLSPAERINFREIARSLGVVPPPPANDSQKIAAVALPAPVTQSPVAAGPLPAQADLLALLQRLPAGVLVARDGAALFANKPLLDLLGYADLHAFAVSGGLNRMFKGRSPEALETSGEGGPVPVVALDGEVQMVDARVQMLDWHGKPASLITLRKAQEPDAIAKLRAAEHELRLRETEARELHAILDTATDGVAVLDEAGRILSLNRSGEALFGYDANEVAGESFTVLIAGESQAAAADYLEGLKRNGVASVLNDGREVLGRARKGGAIPMFMTLGRVGTGTSPKFCAVLRDLTQWKRAERELSDARKEAERASALKSDFLAKISHEIRTPLNAILGFAEVIIEERFGAIGNERYKDYLKDIHASGAHVMSLVNDLLDLSKIEAGKMDMNFASVDANRIVAESVALMQPVAARERVVIRQSLAPRLPNVVADERALRQIVLNLVSNAIKFNNAGGQVIVSTALTDAGHAVLRFRDTGIGMSEAEVEMAMEPFRQLQTSNRQGGTGLGLPLTKALVEANRASFSIKSKKSEGTLVEVAFPPTRVLAE